MSGKKKYPVSSPATIDHLLYILQIMCMKLSSTPFMREFCKMIPSPPKKNGTESNLGILFGIKLG